jgi:hypothetical protein
MARALLGQDLTPEPMDKPPPGPELRNMVLTLDPAKVGLAPTDALPHVWGALMDIGAGHGWASIATLADGTTSLYTSGGGGVIGGGAHEPVIEASRRFLELIESNLDHFEPTDDLHTPSADQTRFLVLTYDGTRASGTNTDQLASGQHPLSTIFAAGNDLVTQLRLAAENRPG